MELRAEPEQEVPMEDDSGPAQSATPTNPNLLQERPAPDLSPYASFISALSSASKGHKVLNLVLTRPKELTKLLPLLRKSDPLLSEILGKVRKALTCSSSNSNKAEKLLGKLELPEVSCDSELFKVFLKEGMKAGKNWENGAALVEILAGIFDIFGPAGKVKDPILGVKMLLSHSLAEDIFLEWQDRKKTVMEYGNVKAQLLKLWKVLVAAFTKISKEEGTEGDKKILENSVTYLMQMYGATLGPADIQIFAILKLYTGSKLRIAVESMPIFGPKCFQQDQDGVKSNPLFAHSVRANHVLACVQDGRAFDTGMKWDPALVSEDGGPLEELYDLRFLLPLLCHVLDEKNVCDVIKVLSHGWIYFIARGLSLEDKGLRNCALLAFKRLVFGLHLAKGFRVQDVKVWLHFLLAVKQGFIPLGETRLPGILSTWMVATCQVVKQPNHPLYSKVTHFLLAKPIIDLTIVPDFINFFNAEDGNRDTRDWIMNILVVGLKNEEDWTIIRKVPTIKLMCSLFPLEKIGAQRTILKILAEGAKIPEVAKDLVDRHSLLLWIANMKFDDRTYYRREVEDIYRNLAEACPQGRDREFIFQFVGRKHNWPCSRKFETLDQDIELEDSNEIQVNGAPISEIMDVL